MGDADELENLMNMNNEYDEYLLYCYDQKFTNYKTKYGKNDKNRM